LDTTSIINRPTIDVNQITSEGFDLKSFIGVEDQNRLAQLRKSPITEQLADEVEDKYKMAAFVESITSNRVNNINANAMMLTAITGKRDTVSTWQAMKNGWRDGRNQMDRAEIRWQEMTGQRPINCDLPSLTEKPHGDGWFESSLGAASNMLPMMYDTSVSGAKYGFLTGLSAAGVAALAGQAGPQVGLPEEIVTVPGAFGLFGKIGLIYGSVTRVSELESGLMFDELLNIRGPNGERIDPNIAISISYGVGAINGLLELAQIDELLKTIPGGRKLLRKGITESVKKVIRNKSLMKLAGKHAFRYGRTIAVETFQEISQESSTIVGGELAKYLTNQVNKGKISHATASEIMKRYEDTAIQSIQAFSVLGAPGHIGGTVVDVVNQQQVKTRDRVSPDTEISRVTDIRPRVDPRALGEKAIPPSGVQALTDKELKTKLLSAKPTSPEWVAAFKETKRRKAAKPEAVSLEAMPQAELEAKLRSTKVSDPEFRDVYDEIQRRRKKPTEVEVVPSKEDIEIEREIAAAVPAKVSPRLYIGNVTQRMRRKFAEIFSKEEGDVKPFLEGPFPTKRTKIEMTSDQATATLVMLEASLDQRLNDNLIRTENDLAQANADWGDIKELRKVLELPKTTRPFTVVRAVKPTVLTPSTVNQRIAFTVQMSKADKVTATRVQQLNNVMARMRKAAKEGHAVAAKHFRELQYLRKQIQLHSRLIAKIKTESSKNIDPFYAKAIEEIQSAIDFKAKPDAKKVFVNI